MDGCRLLYAIIILFLCYMAFLQRIYWSPIKKLLVFFTNSLFLLLFLFIVYCLWGIFVVSVPLLLVGWTDSSGYYMVGWIGCFGYICPLCTPSTISALRLRLPLLCWVTDHIRLSSLYSRELGCYSLQLNSDGLSPVFLISDFTDGYWLALYRCYGTVNSEGGWLRYHLAPP